MTAVNEVESLLQAAQAAVAPPNAAAGGEPLASPATISERLPRSMPNGQDGTPDRVRRILALSVPIIVRLAARAMPVSEIMQWGRGTIVEFGKPVDSHLELLVNDRCIGLGEAV